MTLADEVAAETRATGTRCTFCVWLESLPPADQAEWDQLVADKQRQHAAIRRVAHKHGSPAGLSGIATHRNAAHRT